MRACVLPRQATLPAALPRNPRDWLPRETTHATREPQVLVNIVDGYTGPLSDYLAGSGGDASQEQQGFGFRRKSLEELQRMAAAA